ncbi:MAG: RecB family exonuclease [bacterium]
MTIKKEIKRSSFSQHSLFNKCPRSWYYRYIKKVPEEQEFKHMNAGSVLHTVLEQFYLGNLKFLEDVKTLFDLEWKKYKLENTDLNKDEFWLMIINGMNVNVPINKTELNLKFDNITSYLDAVDTNEHKIYDWKSSKRAPYNEEDYLQQLKVYCWLYYRQFNIIPKEASVFYLRYSGSKGILSFKPTLKDIEETKEWYEKILSKMQYYVDNPDKLPLFNYNYDWSPFKHLWGTENDMLKYKLYLISSWIKVEGPMSPILNNQLKKKFSYKLKNAHFIKKALEDKYKKELAKGNKNAKKPFFDGMIKYWNSEKQILPIGFLNGLKKTLYDYGEFKGKQTDKRLLINVKK